MYMYLEMKNIYWMITNIIRQPAISLLRKNGNEALIRPQTPPEILVACFLHVHREAGRLPEPTVPYASGSKVSCNNAMYHLCGGWVLIEMLWKNSLPKSDVIFWLRTVSSQSLKNNLLIFLVSSDLFLGIDLPVIWTTYSRLTSSKIVKTQVHLQTLAKSAFY